MTETYLKMHKAKTTISLLIDIDEKVHGWEWIQANISASNSRLALSLSNKAPELNLIGHKGVRCPYLNQSYGQRRSYVFSLNLR